MVEFSDTLYPIEYCVSQMKAMEALLVGVLRREKSLVKTSAAEIEHLTLLVSTFSASINYKTWQTGVRASKLSATVHWVWMIWMWMWMP